MRLGIVARLVAKPEVVSVRRIGPHKRRLREAMNGIPKA
jgi:hypothetical protein